MRYQAVVVAIVLLGASARGEAQPNQQQYKAAVKLEVAGDLVGALAGFETIPSEQRDYNTKLHIAGCKKKLGRLKAAEKDYEAIAKDTKADAATVETAESDLADVRARIPKIRIRMTAATAGVVVTVDGDAVTPPVEYRVDPGEHEVLAKRGGAIVYERRVTLPESAGVEVVIEAGTGAAAGTAPPPPPAAVSDVATDAKPRGSAVGPLPFYIGGGVFAVGAAVSFAVAMSSKDTVATNCGSQHSLTCDVDAAGGRSLRTWETLGWVSGGLTLASIGIGIVLHVRGQRSTPSHTALVRPSAGEMNGVVLEGWF